MNRIEIISHSNGETFTRNRNLIADALKHFKDKDIVLMFEQKKNKRTDPQNRWWFGVMVLMAQQRLRELGTLLSKEDVHMMIKLAVAKIDPELMVEEIVIEGTGEIVQRLRSTTEFSTTEFMTLKQHAQQWAADTLDILVPDPEQQMTIG